MASVNEILQEETIRKMVDQEKYSNAVVYRMIALLNRADASIFQELTAALERLAAGAFTLKRLEKLLEGVRAMNAQLYEQIGRELSAELKKLVAFESGYQYELFTKVLPPQVIAEVGVVAVNPQTVYTAAMAQPFRGVLLREALSGLEEGRAKAIRDTVRIGVLGNETTDAIVRKLRGTRANNYADGLFQAPRRHIESTVRTAVSHTAAVARDAFMESNADLLKGEIWLSTLDSRTSHECIIRDNLKYTTDHKPVGHAVPWGLGPGRLHWNALVEGTPVKTARGDVPIESIQAGDSVLTHEGRWRRVTACRAKINESGFVRVVHCESGRVLRATYDHPVQTLGGGWEFVGALEAGDHLLCDLEQLAVVRDVESPVGPASEDSPPIIDESHVALKRTIQLVAANVDLEGDSELWAREVDDRASGLVLCDPSVIEDQSSFHHLLALANALEKLGRHRLGNLLSDIDRNGLPLESDRSASEVTAEQVGRSDSLGDTRHVGRVFGKHASGVRSHDGAGLFAHSPGPMSLSGRPFAESHGSIGKGLLGFVADGDSVPPGVAGEATIGQTMTALDVSKGMTGPDVFAEDQGTEKRVVFGHDRIIALVVQRYEGVVYDLEVDVDSSYVAGGVVVSNCRSASTPWLKSFRDLGIPMDDMDDSTRASMDGQVPGDLAYPEWIARQSAARQDDVIGPKRAAALRAGKIEMKDLYSTKGQYLTIEQLKEKGVQI